MKRILLTFSFVVIVMVNMVAQKERIQSAYIYQFTKLIKWCPAYVSGDFVIGVLGNSPIVAELNGLKGKAVANQTIVIKTFASVPEIEKCNIIFIPLDKSGKLSAVKSKIKSNCTLVITEKFGLIQDGAAVNFIESAGKTVFEINKTALQNHSLVASNKLLTLAKTVYELKD